MPISREVARVLAERTDGNPFYVGALWDHLVARGAVVAHDGRFSVRSVAAAGDVPDSVREVITARLGRLSPVARRVVDLAAIAGMEVESAVLELAAGTDGLTAARSSRARRSSVGAGLLAAVGGARPAYRFSHAIVRDTVAMAVASSGRARLHLAVGRGLEAVHEPDPRPVLAELARHFKAAVPVGPIDRAVQYGRRGGQPGVPRRGVRRGVRPAHGRSRTTARTRRTAPSCSSISGWPTYVTGSTSSRGGPTARRSTWRSRLVRLTLRRLQPSGSSWRRTSRDCPAMPPSSSLGRAIELAVESPVVDANAAQGVVRPGPGGGGSRHGRAGDVGIDDRRTPEPSTTPRVSPSRCRRS